jgi:exopolyphosphatase/guanosine-5'-triphosphate,3'-diphosphate pyrophosphatase
MFSLAAVDMGSNAIRIHISHLLELENSYEFKPVEYLRIPLRLGDDVFTTGRISEEKAEKLAKLGQSLMILFELYEVDHYLCCATSAMREATNNKEIVNLVQKRSGFEIQVIEGELEAEWTSLGLKKYVGSGIWLHIDVGGGSTEINLYLDKQKKVSKSFKIGAVRMLRQEDTSLTKADMLHWTREQLAQVGASGPVTSLGTGGSIVKIHHLAKLKEGNPIQVDQIKKCIDFVASHTLEERIRVLKLNPDRADVLVPSSEIYLSVMEAAGATEMYVPKVGLTDGIFEVLRNQVLQI